MVKSLRRTPEAVALLIASTIVAFWPGYYGRLMTAPAAFHFHAVTATLWLLLLAAQAWTASHRQFGWHRVAGRVSLGFFPILVAGMAGVLDSMSASTLVDPFYRMHGVRLGFLDLIAAGMVVWLYANALATRRNVQLHARYMVATALFLLPPILGRLAGRFIPPLAIHGPDDFWKFTYAVEIGGIAALAVSLALYRADPRYGRPFLLSAIAIMVQVVLFPLIDRVPLWGHAFDTIRQMPGALTIGIGMATGALAVAAGWAAGGRAGNGRRAMPA